MQDLYTLLLARRSIRAYQAKPIEQEKVDTILKSALLSPSSRGRRPWEFIVATDPHLLEKLAVTRGNGPHFLAQAPLVIVIAADPAKCDVWIEDASIAATIIQLAAESLGLGSCWIQVRERMHSPNQTASDYVRSVLSISDKYLIECMITIGYKGEQKTPYVEDDLLWDKVHHNEFCQDDCN